MTTDKRIKFTLLCIVLLCASTASEYILEDLIAMEDNQRAIHNIGDETREGVSNAADHRQLKRPVRQKKADEEASSNTEKEKEKAKDEDDEERKTLAQQVADGKYGLIQTEIFADRPERPGIISYEVNPEVPKDNVNNLGGLKAEEIWLAENHLLVLGGGGFNEGTRDNGGGRRPVWPPIDNYVAPERQVKIPPNPKVPPPFPVQLRPGGPIEFIRGENGTGGPPPFPPFPGFFGPPGNFSGAPPPPPFFPRQGNFSLGNAGPFGPFPPFPFPPPQASPNGSFIPPPPQFLNNLPPGAGFLPPPPRNLTGATPFDEDDPSIYYPPPYDFVYPRDNSSIVPAGPLVPGIVLPPPPDFFAPYNANEKPAPTPKQRPPARRPPSKPLHTTRPTKKPTEKYNYATPSGSTPSKPLATKRPSVQIIRDEEDKNEEHTNEVTPSSFPHALPPNAVVQGWLPIPAPRPFYITGPRKPYAKHQENTTPFELIKERRPTSSQIYSDDGYYYEKPKRLEQEPGRDVLIRNNYPRTKLVNLGGINPEHIYNPALYNQQLYITSTVPPVPYQNTQQPPQSAKALKTFYFYEEPQDLSTTSRPPAQSNYYSTPVPDSAYYLPQQQHRYVQNKYVQPLRSTTRAPPVNYFYITEAPPRAVSTSSRKPPIYEYSYTAPGYGTIEAPKVGTPAPQLGISHATVNNRIPEDNGYNYYDDYIDQTTPRTPVSKPRYNQHTIDSGLVKNSVIYTTERPVYKPASQTKAPPRDYGYTSTQGPVLSTTLSPYVPEHQTQNPYYAFFTHHDSGLIDDITKKYFTIFGQKLNNREGGGATTPLTPTENAYESVTRKPVVHNRVTPAPPSRLQQYYYSTPAPQSLPYYDYDDYYDRINNNNNNYRRLPAQRPQKPQYYEDVSSTRRPPSLEHDTDVNYKGEQEIDADAELIDPQQGLPIDALRQRAAQLQMQAAPIGSSLISYSLPGNGGGHFYFLTPQSIQDEANNYAATAYDQQQPQQQQQQQFEPLYYNKRNAQRQSSSSLTSSNDNAQAQPSGTARSNRRQQNKRRQYNRQTAETA